MFLVIFVFTGLHPADIVIGAASSSTTSNTTRISVHDPSVFYDPSTEIIIFMAAIWHRQLLRI